MSALRVRTSFFILAMAMFFGCSRNHAGGNIGFVAGQGDVGQFILKQLATTDSHSASSNIFPVIAGDWSHSEANDGKIIPKDADGTVIRFPREQYQALETYFRQAYGEPSAKHVGNPNQQGMALDVASVYRLPAGVDVEFGYNKESTLLVILRPAIIKKQ